MVEERTERGEQVALEAYAQMTTTRILPLDEARTLSAADTGRKTDLAMADAIIYSTVKTHRAEPITSDEHLNSLAGVTFIQ